MRQYSPTASPFGAPYSRSTSEPSSSANFHTCVVSSTMIWVLRPFRLTTTWSEA